MTTPPEPQKRYLQEPLPTLTPDQMDLAWDMTHLGTVIAVTRRDRRYVLAFLLDRYLRWLRKQN